MRDKVLRLIQKEGLFPQKSRVVAAFSGGADSSALLHLLWSMREELGISLSACHVNHLLRGAESFRDEEFCRNLCRELEIPLAVYRADVAAAARESGESVELAARRMRGGFLEREAAGGFAATAHTLDDRVETALINLSRGTGLKGLCSIPLRRGVFVRPLLECTREETEEYCRAHKIAYVTDSSNLSRNYTRNRIRLDVVPVLREQSPGFLRCAARTFENLSQDEEYLESRADDALKELSRGEGLDCRGLAGLHPAVSFRVLRRFLGRAGLPYDEQKISLLLQFSGKGQGALQLTERFKASVRGGALVLEQVFPPLKEGFCLPVREGEYTVPSCFCLRLLKMDYEEFEKTVNNDRNLLKNAVDYDKIIGTLLLRQKRPGDVFHPAGRGVGKSLKKLFQESGLPPTLRERVPVLSDDKGIVWVGGFGCDERVLPGRGCRRVLAAEISLLYHKNAEKTGEGERT